MEFDVVIDKHPRYVRVGVAGNPTIGQLLSLIHLLGVESETWDQTAALVDLRRVQTAFSEHEHFRIGEEAACSLNHLDKIASVVPRERITRISQRAARRNGTNVYVFDSEEDAVAWLVGAAG